jgi:hypothetical protein
MPCGDSGIQVPISVSPRKEGTGPSSLHKNLCIGALFFGHHVSLVTLVSANGRRCSASQGVVSGEFADQRRPLATGNGLTSLTTPIILNLFPVGANPASTGEVIFWGYLDDPMILRRRGRGTHAMVATLKRPPPVRRP